MIDEKFFRLLFRVNLQHFDQLHNSSDLNQILERLAYEEDLKTVDSSEALPRPQKLQIHSIHSLLLPFIH